MSFALHPVKAATAALELVVLALALWVLRGYEWPTLSPVEVAPLQALFDPTLFRGDFAVQEALRFSPRFYYNELILLPARAGLPLAWAFAGWHLAVLVTLVGGVRAFAREAGLGAAALATLLVWLVTVGAGAVGAVFFYTHAPVPAVWAGAVAAWGAVFAVRGRLPLAFACFGAAALLQFLVGFYAGLLALPALWLAGQRPRLSALTLSLAVAPWLLGLALVYVPMRLAGGTDAGVFDDATFVEIYAHLRHPHHLVPSTWGWSAWVQAVAFYGGAWWFLRRTSAGRPAGERTLLAATLALAAAALALNWLFVEFHPFAFVAKLQPARITPLAQAVVLALLATRVQTRLAHRDWLGAALLALILLSPFPGLLLLLAALLVPAADRRENFRPFFLAAATLLAFQPFEPSFPDRLAAYFSCAALFAAALLASSLAHRARPLALTLVAALTLVFAALCVRASRAPDWSFRGSPRWLAARFNPDAAPFDPPGRLGARFGAQSHPDAKILVPPTDEPWSFKLHARRAVVVDDKNTPFTDRGLREWKDRMDAVLGTPLTRATDPAAAWRARSPEAIRVTAAHYGARYVLTRDVWHPQLPGIRIDREAGWSLWQLP